MNFTQLAGPPPHNVNVQLASPIFVGATQLMMFGWVGGADQRMTTVGVPISNGQWQSIGTVGCPHRTEYNLVEMGIGNGYFLLNGRSANGDDTVMYSSPDGVLWAPAPGSAPYTPRHSACAVNFNGDLYMYAGYSGLNEGGDLNDVWTCGQGGSISWKQLTAHAQFPATYNAGAASFNGAMYLLGGIVGHVPTNQVWGSMDGQTWVNLGPAPWPERYSPAVAVANGALFVMGGAGNGGHVLNDIWMTTTGKTWTQLSGVEPGVDDLMPTATGNGGTVYIGSARLGIWTGQA